MSLTNCPTSGELSSFLAGGLASQAREGIELHMSRCQPCRQLLAGLYRTSQSDEVTARAPAALKARVLRIPFKNQKPAPMWILRYRPQLAGALAAALLVAVSAALFLSVSESGRIDELPSSEVFRNADGISAGPGLLAPDAGATITSDRIEFRWSQIPEARGFVFTLLNEKGDIVFQSSTTEPHLSVTVLEVRLERGKPYFWYVGAKSSAGTVVDSEIRKLVLA